jgi:ATP-binding cassette subfamily B protein
VNRTYDTTTGAVSIDGVDVRRWNLDSLRSQISMIEQDIFLFSKTIAENIAFGARGDVPRERIEWAARRKPMTSSNRSLMATIRWWASVG